MDNDDILVYDSGPEYLDRYTVFPYRNSDGLERRMYLGLSEGGLAISMWGELSPGQEPSAHLGRKLAFGDLSRETQAHILGRIERTEP